MIQFVQFGDDPGGSKFLQKLDDELATSDCDVVDTVPLAEGGFSEDVLLKVLIGAIDPEVDQAMIGRSRRPEQLERFNYGSWTYSLPLPRASLKHLLDFRPPEDCPEDKLKMLEKFDTVLLIDDSTSMGYPDIFSGGKRKSRWDEVRLQKY